MKNVYKGIINYDNEVVFAPIPTEEDYELIKGMMGTEEIPRDGLYVYKVLLCDNMVDRDSQMFTHKSLERIRDLYIGKVGIKDHSPTAGNIHSRIYKTELVVDEGKQNELGDNYEYVLGYAYTINNEENKAFINEIRGGLKKEVSVGLSNRSLICSICNKEMYSDGHEHVEGETYGGEKCIGLIDDVDDVYEFSFVAIPSQRKAGIIKAFNKKEENSMNLKQIALKICKSADVAPEDAEKLMEEIEKVYKPDTVRKALEEERDKLKEDLAKALKEVEEGRVRRTEEYIDNLIDSMKPKNDKMRALARRAIEELIRVDTDGKLTTESEREIRDELESDEYRPLFNGGSEDTDDEDVEKSGFADYEEDTHAIDEAAALEEEREEIINRLESGEYSGFGKGYEVKSKKKNLEFTRKQVNKLNSHSGMSRKGIHYGN